MPRYGFNFQWMFSYAPGRKPQAVDLGALDFMANEGLNFARMPLDYRFWTKGQDYLHPDERVLDCLDAYLLACGARKIQLCLNLHRAPGYCINGNELERHNLWKDKEAQDGFVFLWELLAKRYAGVSSDEMSFDLVNEPPDIGQYGLTRENHSALMRRAVAAIRKADPNREIVIDGLGGGNLAMPELGDLALIHSTRGYQPMALTHYKADWCQAVNGLPYPVYPGTLWEGKRWDKELLRLHYQSWRDVERLGNVIHIGEFGCYNSVSQAVFLRWFADVLSVFKEYRWGYSLWNFEGPFGVVGHGRPGARFAKRSGYMVDEGMMELYRDAMVAS